MQYKSKNQNEPKKKDRPIDVLITINDKYKVIIEDKTFSSEHDNQLKCYKEIIEKDFPYYTVIGIYYKTGFQGNLNNVYEADYKICDRKIILDILEKYISKTENNILIDYYEHLKYIDEEASKFKTLPVEEWKWYQINGFYDYCQKTLDDTEMFFNYGHVANKSGGFDGMWIYNVDKYTKSVIGLNCELYLQCQFEDQKLKICYRASAKEEKVKIYKETRDNLLWKQVDGEWHNIAEQNGFIKPKQYGCGKTVALGNYVCEIKTYEDAIASIRNAINSFKKLVKDLNI